MLTDAQKTALKADIDANTNTVDIGGVLMPINEVPNTGDTNPAIADWYNAAAAAYFVWRTELSKHELVEESGVDDDGSTATAFVIGGSTGGYIARSVGERDAFNLVFNTVLRCRPNLANVRTAFDDIFSGAGAGAQANRAQWRAKGRRTVNRIERLFVAQTVGGPTQTGNRGTRTNPDTMGFEGTITGQDVTDAWNST